MRIDREIEAQLDALSRRFFDHADALRRTLCPECHRAGGLRMTPNDVHLRLYCVTPMPRRHPDDVDTCTYECVFYSTLLDELPSPRFQAVPAKPKVEAPVRRAATRKASR